MRDNGHLVVWYNTAQREGEEGGGGGGGGDDCCIVGPVPGAGKAGAVEETGLAYSTLSTYVYNNSPHFFLCSQRLKKIPPDK